jgi:undecaprenyl-diphosphatase
MNESIFYFLYNLAHQSEFLDKFFIFSAVYLPYIAIFAAFVFLLKHHEIFESQNPVGAFIEKWKEILGVFVASLVAWIVARVLKVLISTDRPVSALLDIKPLFLDDSFAFPSGHATFFFTLAFIIYFHHKKSGIIFILLAGLISLARVASGVHFPIDILGGFALGALIAYLSRKL